MRKYWALLVGWYIGQVGCLLLGVTTGEKAFLVCLHVTLFALVASLILDKKEKED